MFEYIFVTLLSLGLVRYWKQNKRIVCQKCGWSWKVKDGGDDLYVCHKCNTDNTKFFK
jgi:DNA-directed RNA polymerase subunit RPC12/RpoP